ncbi:MAG: hypothetical protein EBR02_05195 [Alphaproteobacteria bacterium]|nr:hypothetical protein [Alphaproteobacteria bacterium]
MTNLPSVFKKNALTFAVVAMLLLAFWQAFSPYILQWNAIKTTRAQLVSLKSGDVTMMLKNKEKKPTLLFLYAAWCTSCRPTGQELLKRAENGELNGVNVIALSLDDSVPEMVRHFVSEGYHTQLKPYIYDKKSTTPLSSVLALAGSGVSEGLPYVGVFGGNGKLLREEAGALDAQGVGALLAQLRQSIP